VAATINISCINERGAQSSDRRHGCEPEDDAEYVKCENSPVVVGYCPRRDFRCEDVIENEDYGDKADEDGETICLAGS
jgi:hypothetical protein